MSCSACIHGSPFSVISIFSGTAPGKHSCRRARIRALHCRPLVGDESAAFFYWFWQADLDAQKR